MKTPLILEITGGIRIALPPDPRTLSTCVFLEQEDWFEEEAPFVRAVAEPGGRMLDIGASFGTYALNYARAAGPGSRVWAFEPTPEVCEFVRESVRLNGLAGFTLLETAIGAEPGRSRFAAAEASEVNRLDPAAGSLEVPVATLDALDAEHGFGAVDFVKLDVEGHEAAVVAGGRAFFSRESPLVMLEVKAGSKVDFTATVALEALDYRLYRLIPQLGVLAPFDHSHADSFLLNVFACKRDRAERLAGRGLLCLTTTEPAPMASLDALREHLHRIPALVPAGAHIDGVINRAPAGDPSLLLVHYDLAARDRSLPLAMRYAALSQAAALARRIASTGASLVRSMTAARVLRGWGDREIALKTVLRLAGPVLKQVNFPIDAPFLAPLPSYDTWNGAPNAGTWVSAGIIEAAALWSSFGIYWSEPFSVPVADILRGHGRVTPLLERRRQLRRIFEGAQQGSEPHPILATRTPDNLNPSYWCGPSR